MAALIGKDYFCACTREQLCDETCPVYVARENHKDDVITSIAPVKHGKWERGISENGCTTAWFCSLCHYENRHCYDWRFCPQCGARMGGE